MKKLVIPMEKIRENDRKLVGSKAFSLHDIMEDGLKVPAFACVTTLAYEKYLETSFLKSRILMELSRKDIQDMRWEEMWDTSLRIRNMFLNTPIPEELDMEIREKLAERFGDKSVVVRSSAIGEDSAKTSFAGLHESYVNVKGLDSIMEHIRLVWASLWSDAALLYREELGLNIKNSSMSVMIQELIDSKVSGVIFSSDPEKSDQMIIEAVHGLNKGLVDGNVEPDRWIIDRENAVIIQHVDPSSREKMTVLRNTGTALEKTSPAISKTPPLGENDVHELHEIALIMESNFGNPQDIEWTKKNGEIYVLQSRPITTSEKDEKLWYLSLRKTIDNLQDLRERVESELIPEMISDAKALKSIEVGILSDKELAREITRRKELYNGWNKKYKEEFIPFAHGMRLFGQVYNDILKPSNPYEFMDLLSGTELLSIKRNEELNQLADMLRNDASLMKKAKDNVVEGDFREKIEDFFRNFGHSGIFKNQEELLRLIVELASNPEKEMPVKRNASGLEGRFISAFSETDREFAEELLDIARASYRLRDDDNIYLGKIEDQYIVALNEAKKRVATRIKSRFEYFDINDDIEEKELLKALNDDNYVPVKKTIIKEEILVKKAHQRQIQGQPAGEGFVTGTARVVTKNEELFDIKFGEIMVCDAIEPGMTFVVPLVSGIVERRGGMLIHGAIIAREYGIPCVTGIPDATKIIKNGDVLTVDGYLGIVTIKRKAITG
ncbi:PEP/pyruvate-binding domain-containing protein [Methanolobus sp. ZRKC4]|uniref:PEP/pyruvate-binding domain-containing protein n=1 Tax=Methanolobus sp. ZRKC4 TaxID=3125787 RepID=UPI003247E2A0